MLEDYEASNRPVTVQEPHIKVFPELVSASYLGRREIICRKLVFERYYTPLAFTKVSAG